MQPDIKISGLPSDSSLDGNHYFPLNDPTGPTTKRTTLTTLLDYINANLSSTQIQTILAGLAGSQSMLINGGMNVWQRNTSATPNDDVYTGCDRWNFLTEANSAWTVARDTDVPSTGGTKYSMKFSNVTLNNQCGIVQILEARDAAKLFGGKASLSFYAKTSGTEIGKLRCAILSWTGSEDVVTSDVIGTWAQSGTNPTWATNWTMENTPVDLTLTSSWQRFTAENIAIDTASTKNVAVVIWVDDGTITAGDDFWLTQVQLEVGEKATTYKPIPYQNELDACMRYYADYGTQAFRVYLSNVYRMGQNFSVPMRITPTATITFSGGTIAANNSAPGGANGFNYDVQITGAGVGVIDSSVTVLRFDAEM
jgi:hypothetical protein